MLIIGCFEIVGVVLYYKTGISPYFLCVYSEYEKKSAHSLSQFHEKVKNVS